MDIKELLIQKILVLDGAMGTMIQKENLEEEDFRGERFIDHPLPLKGDNDLLSITKPEIIRQIHREYFKAGADIAETNTFNANALSQADYGLESVVYDINLSAAQLAREVADEFNATEPEKPRFVAGAIGPTTKTASISSDVSNPGYRAVTYDQLVEAYHEQARGLMDGGVDILLIETIFDTLNAKAALFAVRKLFEEYRKELPIMISGTITDASGRTLSGQTTEAFMISMSYVSLLSIGLNCALGASALRPYLKVLANKSEYFISTHPNAGLPNEFGEYDETPEKMAAQIEEFLDEGLVNIVGRCRGTTPDHIRAIAEIAAKYEPRRLLIESEVE